MIREVVKVKEFAVDFYDKAVAGLETLNADKEEAKRLACEEVDKSFEERESFLNKTIADSTYIITEEVEDYVEEIVEEATEVSEEPVYTEC